MKSVLPLWFLIFMLCGLSSGVNAQIYKCSLPGERVVYSDRKCSPLESGGRIKVTDNIMDSPGSKREANLAALRAARLNHPVQAPFIDGNVASNNAANNNVTNATEPARGGRWDGSSENFVVYPLLGPGVYFNR